MIKSTLDRVVLSHFVLMNSSAHFKQIWIYGSSYESFLVAVVNPNMGALQSWAEENGLTGDFDTICENPKAKAYILSELTNTAKEKKVIPHPVSTYRQQTPLFCSYLDSFNSVLNVYD